MAKYGLLMAEPEAYGLIMDSTELLMRDIITDLVVQSRIRRQDMDPKMNQSKAGDTVKVNNTLYFDQGSEQGNDLYDPNGVLRRQFSFRPKEAGNLELICTSNPSKELVHIVGQEYDLMKEKQDIRFEQLPNSEAVSGSNLSTGAVSNFGSTAVDDTSSTNALKDPLKNKGMRKKMMDPESLKLREQKMKETRRQ